MRTFITYKFSSAEIHEVVIANSAEQALKLAGLTPKNCEMATVEAYDLGADYGAIDKKTAEFHFLRAIHDGMNIQRIAEHCRKLNLI